VKKLIFKEKKLFRLLFLLNTIFNKKEIYILGSGVSSKRFFENIDNKFKKKIKIYDSEATKTNFLKKKIFKSIDYKEAFIFICSMYFDKIKMRYKKHKNNFLHCNLFEIVRDKKNILLLKKIYLALKSKKSKDELLNYYFSLLNGRKKSNLNQLKNIYFLKKKIKLEYNSYAVDAGAYVGEISKKINKIYKTKVLAFEPNKENFKILNKKKSKNIQCFNLALSKKNTFLELTNSKDSSNVLGFKSKEKDMRTKVQAVKLDKFLNYNIQFLKIDVEGAEIQLLEGAKKVLKKFKPNLAISVYHKHNDILEIYRFIESLRVFKKHKLHFKHYGKNYTDTILYWYK
tara:strand:- start:1062 stop:2090 length:1029 start_codon:yes stop_codon:yes gene_type:complete